MKLKVPYGVDAKQVLARLNNNVELFQRFISSFLQQLNTFQYEMTRLIEAKDSASLKALLHKLKGTAANLNAADIHKASGDLESEIACGQTISALNFGPLLEAIAKSQTDEFEIETGSNKAISELAQLDTVESIAYVETIILALQDDFGSALKQTRKLEALLDTNLFAEEIEQVVETMYEFDADLSRQALSKLLDKMRLAYAKEF